MINEIINKQLVKIIVKANSNKNELIGFDKEKKAYVVKIKAKAEKGKANIEIIKFFRKLLKKEAKIIKGLKSKEKILRLV